MVSGRTQLSIIVLFYAFVCGYFIFVGIMLFGFNLLFIFVCTSRDLYVYRCVVLFYK